MFLEQRTPSLQGTFQMNSHCQLPDGCARIKRAVLRRTLALAALLTILLTAPAMVAAPDKIVATHNNKDLPPMTRPLCPYAEVAQWKGSGDTNDDANLFA